jgi:S1-C subfamily serine protease
MLITTILVLVGAVQADESNYTHRPAASLRSQSLESQDEGSPSSFGNDQLVQAYRILRPSLLRVYLPAAPSTQELAGLANDPHDLLDRIVSGVVLREIEQGCLVVVPGVWPVGSAPLKVIGLNGLMAYQGVPIAVSPSYSLSLLQVEGLQVEAPPFGLCETLPVGSATLVLGNPFGLDGSVSVGILSGRGRNLGQARDLIQISNPLNPGDGGGIVADWGGHLIGIAMTSLDEAARIRSGGLPGLMSRARGISFAVPLHHVLEAFEEQLALPADHQRLRLGVEVHEAVIPREIRRKLALPIATALRISWVDSEQAAGLAGMQEGDYLLGVGGRPLSSISCLYSALRTVTLESNAKVLRGNQTLDLKLVFPMPSDPALRKIHAPNAMPMVPAVVGESKKKD